MSLINRRLFERETLLNITVNIIPLFIIGFFVFLFVAIAPWGYEPLMTAVMIGLHVIPFVGLALLTYLSAIAVETGDEEAEVDAEAVGARAEERSVESDAGTGTDAELESGARTEDDAEAERGAGTTEDAESKSETGDTGEDAQDPRGE